VLRLSLAGIAGEYADRLGTGAGLPAGEGGAMNYKIMVNLIHITKKTSGPRLWIQFDTDDLPFFRIAWCSGLWGPWMGWN